MRYIIVEDQSYPINSLDELETAQRAMRRAGLSKVPVWNGHPDCPDSYQDQKATLLA
jgi:hypothetical protein